MKKLILIILVLLSYENLKAQNLVIQATGSTDGCSCVMLEVINPPINYTFSWYAGNYDCFFPAGSFALPAFGTQYCAMATGEFYCIGTPTMGGIQEISNPVLVRVLPGSFGSLLLPSPIASGPVNCVNSVSLCIPYLYYQPWPNTTIKWYLNNVLLAGATGGSYTATQGGYYKYTITNGCVVAPSDSILVTKAPSNQLTAGGPLTFCQGGSVQLNASTGFGYNYLWKKNNTIISGATSSVYSATASGTYTVSVSNSCGTATSSSINVVVNANPTPVITSHGPLVLCNGDSVKLTVNTGTGASYQWKRYNSVIAGATSSTYYARTTGNYKVTKTNSTGCSGSSSPTSVTVNSLPVAVISALGPTSFCAGDSVNLLANTGIGFVYQWKRNGGNIAGASALNYIAKTAGTYKVKVTNSNGCTKLSPGVSVSVPCRDYSALQVDDDFLVNVYPNPSTGIFTLTINSSIDDEVTFRILDLMGRLASFNMIKKTENIFQIDNLNQGVYFLELNAGERHKLIRIISMKE